MLGPQVATGRELRRRLNAWLRQRGRGGVARRRSLGLRDTCRWCPLHGA